jgi:hypothetical protein
MKNASFFNELLFSQKTFEKSISLSVKKQNGIYLTNTLSIIDDILSVIDFSTIENKKILEPACGQGIFVLRILSKVHEQNSDKAFMDKFISQNLIFNDVDAQMVEHTKEAIANFYFFLFDTQYKGIFQGYTSDFTLRNNQNKIDLFSTDSTIILDKFYEKVDYVVGNPPYVSLYGRRDQKQNEQQRIDYLQNYNQFPTHVQNGKINLVMLFLEHSLDFLKPDGKMSFIIDVAFFETAYQYTRQFLLKNTRIEVLITDIKDFEVVSGQLILQASKNQDNETNIVKIQDGKSKQTYFINQSVWQNPKDEYKFRFNGCSISQQIIDTIEAKKDKTILELYPNKNLRTCTMLLDMENKFTGQFEGKNNENKPIYPYYQGSKSLTDKYAPLKFEKYFIYDKPLQDEINDALKIDLEKQGIKNKKRIGLGEPIIYNNPKVFIRQSAKEIIATLDFGESAANNSLYVFSLRDNSENTLFTLKFLCGWLNSDLMTFYAQQTTIIRFSQGKQPQIKISDLGTIPIPDSPSFQQKIVDLVDEIILNQGDIELFKKGINQLIFDYYALNETQIKHLLNSIKGF